MVELLYGGEEGSNFDISVVEMRDPPGLIVEGIEEGKISSQKDGYTSASWK